MAIKRILVPTDFSAASRQALDYAVELGRQQKADIVILHAVEPINFAVTGGTYGVGFDANTIYKELERSARAQLKRLADDLRKRRVRARTMHAVGTPHTVIVDGAKQLKADLIVMSTHGRSGLAHVFLGSVAERVVRSASCPVLTMHPSAARRRRARSTRGPAPRRPGGRRTSKRTHAARRSRHRPL